MGPLVTLFDPQPDLRELPTRLPSPFDPGPPHPLARRAANELRRRLESPTGPWRDGERGKMFGVLVVADTAGRIGYLRAFSGMLAGSWLVDGFVGPTFDLADRQAFWPEVEAALTADEQALHELRHGDAARRLAEERLAVDDRYRDESKRLAEAHARRRAERHAARAKLAGREGPEVARARHALEQESRADTAELRRLRKDHRAETEQLAARQAAIDEAAATLEARRRARSNELLVRVFGGYQLPSGRGDRRSLAELFAPEAPPGGAGDCAAPKLLAHALDRGLRPLALTELWWGPPPAGGGRHEGAYYPACRRKCGPVVSFMLEGLDVEPAPLFGAAPIPRDEPRVLFEDRHLIVVEKPVGLLSVPGRLARLRDSVLTRLMGRYPEPPLLVHRLDLDTSGALLVARDPATHFALQRQFLLRTLDKRYVALLEGAVSGNDGVIDLALRVDLDDRPRQLHDPIHGKPAVTTWQVLAREAGRVRVALHPHTGRTHQLRVHAAHPLGLGAPIVGDRLYGTPGGRLMLHAESLAFDHPHTGGRIRVTSPPPF
jgi:tRNA pseudouridine32 synthase/23S rRNA pseudouridine746 synthase